MVWHLVFTHISSEIALLFCPVDVLYDSHKKYGPVVKLWLGPMQLLVSVKEPALLKEILVKAEDKLLLTGRAFRLAFGRSSLFTSSFEKVQVLYFPSCVLFKFLVRPQMLWYITD